MHLRQRFHGEQRVHLDRSGCRVAAQVMAQQIHDHQVLGTVLRAGRQFVLQAVVFRRVGMAGGSALDGLGHHLAVAHGQEQFRRQAQDFAFRCQHPRGVRRLCQREQALHGLGAGTLAAGPECLGIVHLVAVAGLQVFLYSGDIAQVTVLGREGSKVVPQGKGQGSVTGLAFLDNDFRVIQWAGIARKRHHFGMVPVVIDEDEATVVAQQHVREVLPWVAKRQSCFIPQAAQPASLERRDRTLGGCRKVLLQ